MRFSRIVLHRYGHLTDLEIPLAPHAPDLHLILGANEAGKSTTQAALADLLYGFPDRTDYAYRHAMPDLALGARLGPPGQERDVLRRKRRLKSLEGADGTALEEAVLGLGTIDRRTFLHQFSLDHARLRAGGEAMLRADTDLGRLLFQSGAGLDWLGERLTRLQVDAAELFRPRGQRQAVNHALAERAAAERRKRATALSDRDFRRAGEAAAEAEQALAALRDRRQTINQTRTRLNRLRRTIPVLRRIDRAREERDRLGPVRDLPADMPVRLAAAVAAHRQAVQALATARRERERAEAARDAITVDDTLLARATALSEILGEPFGRYRAAQEDLPRRRQKRVQQAAIIATRGRDIGLAELTPETADGRLPTDQRLAALRRLVQTHAERRQALRLAEAALAKARRAEAAAAQALEDSPAPPTAEPLVQAIAAADADPGLATRLETVEAQAAAIRDDIAKRLGRLVPPVAEGVARQALPAAGTVAAFAEELAALDARIAASAAEGERLEAERLALDQECARLLAVGGAVPAERLEEARARRDRGWALVRCRYIDGPPPDDKALNSFAGALPLPDAYSEAVAEADRVADARHVRAEDSGRLAGKAADLDAVRGRLARVDDRRRREADDRTALLDRWRAAWAANGIVPLAPGPMADWLAGLEAAEAARLDLARHEAAAAREQAREADLRRRLTDALAAHDAASDATGDLPRLLAMARTLLDRLTTADRDRATAEKAAQARTEAAAEARQEHRQADADLDAWQRDWTEALADWSLPPNTDPADIEPVLKAWGDIQDAHKEIRGADGLDHRIAAMEDDCRRFADGLAALTAAVAPDLTSEPTPRQAERLKDRLDRAHTAAERKADAVREAAARAEATAAAEADEARAKEGLGVLLVELGVESPAAAAPVLERAEAARRADRTLAEQAGELQTLDDGLGEAALRQDAEGRDPDALAGEVAALDDEDALIDAEIEREAAALQDARRRLDGFRQAGAAAAEAAEAAERWAAEARHGAERFVRLTTTAALLRHAVERYRRENEAPLLTRASVLFRRLTLDRYAGLEVDRDDPDRPALRARAADGGGTVPVGRLSDGARDQLYLALRIAGLELLLDRGTVLPFIADDLFVNFDDERAGAGLAVLAELATRTQVLCFTHHRHLLVLAEAALQDRFAAVEMPG